MDKQKAKNIRRARRVVRVRRRIQGTATKPRLAVFKSVHHTYAQVIDDLSGTTLAAASTTEKALGVAKTGNIEAAAAVGAKVAERAASKGVKEVVFDRRGFKFHGRVKALADAARKAGLTF
ncbi:MAG: 50S ribosomal protein L18 [Phycisphaeraceae bacterium]|nr:MAG: 50S ribosomal protein L18 [Phycisphaeraceae bacterium]